MSSQDLTKVLKDLEECLKLRRETEREIEQAKTEEHLQQRIQLDLKSQLEKKKCSIRESERKKKELEANYLTLRDLLDGVLKTDKLFKNLEIVDGFRSEMKDNAIKSLQDNINTLDFNYEVQAPSGDLATFSQAQAGSN